jgi:hypothetical protein
MRTETSKIERGRSASPLAIVVIVATFCMLLVPSMATAIVSPSPLSKPVNTVLPSLTGTPAVGKALSCSTGSWTNNPTSFTYTWLRNGSLIPGQAASTYIVQSADLGHSISCEVTAGKLNGEYTISGLPSGSYKVFFSDSDGNNNYLTQYYNGKSSFAEADAVSVTAGGITPNINAALQAGGQISGKVTAASGGAALANIEVCASGTAGGGCASTNGGGEYTILGLPTGSYSVNFSVGFEAGNYMGQYYNGKSSSVEADAVSVTAGGITPNINASLQAGGQISGKVTAASGGAALANIEVCAEESGSDGLFGNCASTNGAGEYTISGLSTGNYSVDFFSDSEGSNYLTQYFENQTSPVTATPVSVTAGGTTPNINASLQAGGQISGKVTAASGGGALANIEVCAGESCASTNSAGEYTLSGLPTGSYTVGFFAGFEAGNYAGQYYNGKSSSAEAEAVSVTVGGTTPNINAALQTGGQIAGKVSDASTHAVLAKVEVCAETLTGEGFGNCTATNAAGEYTISGLSTGSYSVGFFPAFEGGNYLTQYYSGKSLSTEANPVPVTIGSTTPAINAEMHAGGQITGKVIAAANGAPVGGIEVCAESTSGSGFGCGFTNSAANSTVATSNALVVPAPNANFTQAKAPVFDAKKGELDFFFRVPSAGTFRWSLFFRNSDVGFADSLGLSLADRGLVAEAARKNKKSKKCKKGYLKHHSKCVRLLVPFGSGSQNVPAGTVEIKVHASSKAIKALNAGRTLHVSGAFTFQSALGGAPVTHTESAVVRKPKKHSKKHGKKHGR